MTSTVAPVAVSSCPGHDATGAVGAIDHDAQLPPDAPRECRPVLQVAIEVARGVDVATERVVASAPRIRRPAR